MAQTVPTPPADARRPLPRRGRTPAPKTARPRFLLIDGLWMAALAALSLIVLQFTRRSLPQTEIGTGLAPLLILDPLAAKIVALAASAGTVAMLYLLGWRARDRSTGVIAALLLATSLPFAAQAPASSLLFALLTVSALFAFVAGSSLAALLLAAIATLMRPDGLLLGIVLLALSLAQRRRRAVLGVGLYVAVTAVGWAALHFAGRQPLPLPASESHAWLARWAAAPANLVVLWFLLPFCAELSEPQRRARWLPVLLWAILYFGLESLWRFGDPGATLLPFLPLLFVLAAAGLSRLLPVLAGDVPIPAARYLLAALAVLSLVAIRARLEWPSAQAMRPASSAPLPAAPPSIAAPTAPTPAATTLVPRAAPAQPSPPERSSSRPPVITHPAPARSPSKPPAVAVSRHAARPNPQGPARRKGQRAGRPRPAAGSIPVRGL